MRKKHLAIKAFGVHLRQLREARDMSQQELADISDIDKTTIQRIENAKFSVTMDTMISIAKALKVPPMELVHFTIPREKQK